MTSPSLDEPDCCGSEPPATWVTADGIPGQYGDCWCTLSPGHDGLCLCGPCASHCGAPGWNAEASS